MDEIFGILMEQMGLFLFYMIVGVILVKVHVLAKDTLETLSRFVMKLAMPVMIFINTVGGVDRDSLVHSLSVLGLAVVFYVCTFLISKGLSVLFHLKGDRASVYRALSMFGNIGFMGIPIISSVFPEQGMLYISVFTIIDQLVLWTLGVKLTTPGGQGSFQPKKMINPCTVAVVLALLMVVSGLSLPPLLHTALDKIGGTATPLAMIYLGGVFACMDVKTYVRVREFYGIVVVKMMVFPVLLYMACGFLPIDESVRLTFALLAAMPAMSSIVMMAKASGSEGDYAMGGIFVTTVCSIVSIPAVFWVLQQVAQTMKV
ncbi:MAG: AEC family transporter [Acutalibacteraceae bacterium]